MLRENEKIQSFQMDPNEHTELILNCSIYDAERCVMISREKYDEVLLIICILREKK